MITVYGASDDLIEVEGDIAEEFSAILDFERKGADGGYLAFSDGTVLRITYGEGHGAFWRISPLMNGTGSLTITQATDEDDDYSDKATIAGDIRWVVLGSDYARAQRKAHA